MSRCKICRAEYERKFMNQKTCGDDICKIEWKRQLAIHKAERKAIRERREAIKSRSEWAREAQAAFNQFIRALDENEPCISCGRHHEGQYHAGHYLSRGSHPELAFQEMNVWKQCAPCNNHLSGNAINFRKRLVEKFGTEFVEWLEGPHPPKKYTIADYRAIRDTYRALLKALLNERKQGKWRSTIGRRSDRMGAEIAHAGIPKDVSGVLA